MDLIVLGINENEIIDVIFLKEECFLGVNS